MSLARRVHLLGRATEYELRKVSVFRTGFLVREVLNGVIAPLSMIAVYWALYSSGGERMIRGWSLAELVRYLIGVAIFSKLVIHNRVLDVAEQIFEGYFTKYLVMPFPFVLLPLARWLQYTLLQVVVVGVVWGTGALFGPSWWPMPADAWAVPQALALALLGSLCFLELYLIINLLAFWLDVVWSLLVMSVFVTDFTGGRLVPVTHMPEAVGTAFQFGFPYWTFAAPVERLMGRLDGLDFGRGVLVLGVSLVLLELGRRAVWARGTLQYTGAGM